MTRTSSLSIWRERLFGTPFTGFTSVVLVILMAWIAIPLIRWAVIDATWLGSTRADCAPGGACWVFIRARFGQFMYGLYPVDQRWRVDIAGIAFVLGIASVVLAPQRFRLKLGLAMLVILPPLGIWLLSGGFGLRYVETRDWAG